MTRSTSWTAQPRLFLSCSKKAHQHTIETKLNAQQAVAPGAELLALALDELAQARLLEGEAREQGPIMEGRRQMLQKLAGVGAALLIPAIVTLAPSRAYAQGTLLGTGAACTTSGQCVSGCCASNSAGSCSNSHCSVGCANCRP